MKIKAVLFDLDGTLLPLDQDEFVKAYIGEISAKLAPFGYEPRAFVGAIWAGMAAMVRNDGSQTNETVFWKSFGEAIGVRRQGDVAQFEAFYENEFNKVRDVCGFAPEAARTVRSLKERGFITALATNPVFPSTATEKRMSWAGLSPSDFAAYTTFENSRYCKPDPRYYEELAKKLGVSPEECLMVGNDAEEDMVAEETGMKVFLLTDHTVNKKEKDISRYPRGGFAELEAFLEKI